MKTAAQEIEERFLCDNCDKKLTNSFCKDRHSSNTGYLETLYLKPATKTFNFCGLECLNNYRENHRA